MPNITVENSGILNPAVLYLQLIILCMRPICVSLLNNIKYFISYDFFLLNIFCNNLRISNKFNDSEMLNIFGNNLRISNKFYDSKMLNIFCDNISVLNVFVVNRCNFCDKWRRRLKRWIDRWRNDLHISNKNMRTHAIRAVMKEINKIYR